MAGLCRKWCAGNPGNGGWIDPEYAFSSEVRLIGSVCVEELLKVSRYREAYKQVCHHYGKD